MVKVLRRLPWWCKLLLVGGLLVGIIIYFKYIIMAVVGWFLLWIFIRVVQVQSSRHSSNININIHEGTDSPRSNSWVKGGLGTNYYAPKINQKGADFITGRRKIR